MAHIRERGLKFAVAWIEDGRQRMKTVGVDRRAAERLKVEIEARLIRQQMGLADAAESRLQAAERTPIDEHVEDWARDMRAKDLSPKHVTEFPKQVRKIISLAWVNRLSELSPSAIQVALGKIRSSGMAPHTVKHHYSAVRAFARFLVRDGRLRVAPTVHVTPPSLVETRPRANPGMVRSRRALKADEAKALVEVAASREPYAGVSGPERAILYRLALTTGLRVKELGALTPRSFKDLEGEDASPTVVLAASATKNRKPARQPIPRELAGELAAWLASKPADKLLWPKWCHFRAAKMLRRDLKAAGIPCETEEGRVDFHALRHTFVTRLLATGCDLKTAQTLARHSTPVLTMNHYAHTEDDNLRAAVERLG